MYGIRPACFSDRNEFGKLRHLFSLVLNCTCYLAGDIKHDDYQCSELEHTHHKRCCENLVYSMERFKSVGWFSTRPVM